MIYLIDCYVLKHAIACPEKARTVWRVHCKFFLTWENKRILEILLFST